MAGMRPAEAASVVRIAAPVGVTSSAFTPVSTTGKPRRSPTVPGAGTGIRPCGPATVPPPTRLLIYLAIHLGRAKISLHHLARDQRPPRERQLGQLGPEPLERHASVQKRRHDHVPRRPTRTIEVSHPHPTLTSRPKSNHLLLSPTKPNVEPLRLPPIPPS